MLQQQTEQQTNEYQKVKNKNSKFFSDTKCYSDYFTFAWHNRFCCV